MCKTLRILGYSPREEHILDINSRYSPCFGLFREIIPVQIPVTQRLEELFLLKTVRFLLKTVRFLLKTVIILPKTEVQTVHILPKTEVQTVHILPYPG